MPIVSVSNVEKIYHQGKMEIKALDDVSVSVDRGEGRFSSPDAGIWQAG